MKQLIVIALYGACLGALITHTTAKPDKQDGRGCVILQGQQTFARSSGGYYFPGVVVYCSSSSSNAPQFSPPVFTQDGGINQAVSLADAIAQLLELGYHIEHVEELNYTLVK